VVYPNSVTVYGTADAPVVLQSSDAKVVESTQIAREPVTELENTPVGRAVPPLPPAVALWPPAMTKAPHATKSIRCRTFTIVARAFGLSRAEARLASLIAGGMAPDAAAQKLGVSRETVRNQLKAVFAKTETHRQNEVAALLAQLE
jgi:DNA-binding CsgD family transcriptional regulator